MRVNLSLMFILDFLIFGFGDYWVFLGLFLIYDKMVNWEEGGEEIEDRGVGEYLYGWVELGLWRF